MKDQTNKDLRFLRLLEQDRHLVENMIMIISGVERLSYPDYMWNLFGVVGDDDPDRMSEEDFECRREEVLAAVKDHLLEEIQRDLVLMDEVIDKTRQKNLIPSEESGNP